VHVTRRAQTWHGDAKSARPDSDDRVPQWWVQDCGGGYWPKLVVVSLGIKSLLPNEEELVEASSEKRNEDPLVKH
jgi:hypothetical protein